MGDDFDSLSDEALFGYLMGAASEGGMRLLIEQRGDEWFAQARAVSGLGGWMVVSEANGTDRRTAMLQLAHVFAAGRLIPVGRGDRTLTAQLDRARRGR